MTEGLFVVATIVAKPDQADALRTLLVSAVEAFRREDGCLSYLLYEDANQAGRFVTYETWRDKAALDAHMVSPTMQAAGPHLPALLAEPPTIMPLTVVLG